MLLRLIEQSTPSRCNLPSYSRRDTEMSWSSSWELLWEGHTGKRAGAGLGLARCQVDQVPRARQRVHCLLGPETTCAIFHQAALADDIGKARPTARWCIMLLMLQNQILQEKAAGRGLKRNPAHLSVQTQDQQCLHHFDRCSPNLFVKPSNVEGSLMSPASLDYSYHYKVFVFPNDQPLFAIRTYFFLPHAK